MSKSIDDLSDEVAAVAKDVAVIKAQLELIPRVDPVRCAIQEGVLDNHEERIVKLEKIQGRENTLRIAMGAIGLGVAFALKYVFVALQKLFVG